KTPAKPPAGPAGEKPNGVNAPSPLEALKLPDGAVVIICEGTKEALQLVPKAIVLTVDEYQKLLEQLDQLKRQNKSDKPANPSICKLTGRIADDLVHLQAQFEFKTDVPGAIVNLGCQRAWPIDARLDGELAWLQTGEDGFVIQADKPGTHVARLDLLMPVVAKSRGTGAGRGFDLDLPGAAITTLDQLDLPGTAAEVLIGARSVRPRQLDAQHGRLEAVPIVPANP